MTLPTRLRALAGIAEGDLVEAAFHRGRIVITPKLPIDRSKFPTADDEYTPAQRRAIDARLNRAAAEVKKGHVSPERLRPLRNLPRPPRPTPSSSMGRSALDVLAKLPGQKQRPCSRRAILRSGWITQL
jgi:hypothetical protein